MGDRRRFLPRLQQSSPPPGHLPASKNVKELSKPITQVILFVLRTGYGHPCQPNGIAERHWAVFFFLLFCTMTNKCTIISQIITPLHVSTLSCHPQGACKTIPCQVTQVFQMQLLVTQFTGVLTSP